MMTFIFIILYLIGYVLAFPLILILKRDVVAELSDIFISILLSLLSWIAVIGILLMLTVARVICWREDHQDDHDNIITEIVDKIDLFADHVEDLINKIFHMEDE